MHEKGSYYTQYGSIYNRCTGEMFGDSLSILISLDPGTLHRVGDKDWVESCFATYHKAYTESGLIEEADSLRVITFNIKRENLGFAPEGYNFDINEVCTIINWFSNSIGERMQQFLEMPLDDMKAKIKELQEYGF